MLRFKGGACGRNHTAVAAEPRMALDCWKKSMQIEQPRVVKVWSTGKLLKWHRTKLSPHVPCCEMACR